MNQIIHKKLALSKWTAVRPEHSEKHFLIQSVTQRRRNVPATCLLEAVLNRHQFELDCYVLKDSSRWLSGWR
ncbi:MAG: TIGR02450 family Trp-rich protein [Candidatus Binatia bacterium]